MNPTLLPVARELFAQWQRARGSRTELALRPFSRGWEDLLEDANLVSAADRSEAERDARLLEIDGWIEVRPVRYKLHLIDRIVIPLPAELRWREAFGFVPPSDEEARLIREFPWEPPLAFLRDLRLSISFAELCQLNDFLKSGTGACSLVPIKERSLQIFGDEKRLDALLTSSLFRPDRLELEKHLCCEVVGEPLPWKRGPNEAAQQPIIIIENAATWHTYCRWNAEQKLFSAVSYGCGNRFVDGVHYLGDIFAELGGPRRIFYFGDLDPRGLQIPQDAAKHAKSTGCPAIEPHVWSYRQLFTLGSGRGQPWEGEEPSSTLCDWLGECAEPARILFASRQRLAQEHVGWEFLKSQINKNGPPPPDNAFFRLP
jgi:hypothetical protein